MTTETTVSISATDVSKKEKHCFRFRPPQQKPLPMIASLAVTAPGPPASPWDTCCRRFVATAPAHSCDGGYPVELRLVALAVNQSQSSPALLNRSKLFRRRYFGSDWRYCRSASLSFSSGKVIMLSSSFRSCT
jgi:hypothetical protein